MFHRAIIQSGSALNPWAYNSRDNTVDRAFRLGKKLGCDTEDTDTLLQFLREIPADKLPPASGEILHKNVSLNNFYIKYINLSCQFI